MRNLTFLLKFLFFFLILVWSFFATDVNFNTVKIDGILVKCKAIKGRVRKVAYGNVLGVFESHGQSQVYHLFNVRKTLGERLPGPSSSFRYNLNVFGESRPIPKRIHIMKNLMKIPIKRLEPKSDRNEYTIRTVICKGELWSTMFT